MKKILIVKTGYTHKGLFSKYGDFDDWLSRKIDSKFFNVVVENALSQPNYDSHTGISAVIITGSHSNVTERTAWMLHLMHWVKELIDNETPVLGVCFGHQLMTSALGGKVGFHKQGGEFGLSNITFNKCDENILKDLPTNMPAFVSHEQTVLKLPEGASSIGANSFEPNHLVQYAKYAWGTQFHPEFTPAISKYYFEKNGEVGQLGNPKQNAEAVKYGSIFINNFLLINSDN